MMTSQGALRSPKLGGLVPDWGSFARGAHWLCGNHLWLSHLQKVVLAFCGWRPGMLTILERPGHPVSHEKSSIPGCPVPSLRNPGGGKSSQKVRTWFRTKKLRALATAAGLPTDVHQPHQHHLRSHAPLQPAFRPRTPGHVLETSNQDTVVLFPL